MEGATYSLPTPQKRSQVLIPLYLFGCCFSQGSAGLFFHPRKREKKNELSRFAFSVKLLSNSTPQG